jgi:hypothetical protein
LSAAIIELRSPALGKKKHKPAPPRIIAPEPPPAQWGVNEDALDMEANADVELRFNPSVDGKRRTRQDVFALLYFRPGSRMSDHAYAAARRLQEDMAILHRTQGACDAIRTAGQNQTGALAVVTEDFALARVHAGERIDRVLDGYRDAHGVWHPSGMKPWAASLIRALCEQQIAPAVEVVEARVIPGRDEAKRPIPPPPEQQARAHWKALVRKHTNEKRPSQAGEMVRLATDALAESYRRIDNEPRAAA